MQCRSLCWLHLRQSQKCEALLEGHFILSSGLHSNRYLQCAKILQYPKIAEELGAAIAKKFSDMQIDVVVGPAMGGVIIAQEVARAIGCRSIFSERENGAMTLRRGFTVKEGERVLICEDVCTTGGSAKEVGAMLRAKGANVVGYTSIIDRSGGKVQFDAPYRALETLTVETYDPSDCPLCKAGTTAVKPGSHGLK